MSKNRNKLIKSNQSHIFKQLNKIYSVNHSYGLEFASAQMNLEDKDCRVSSEIQILLNNFWDNWDLVDNSLNYKMLDINYYYFDCGVQLMTLSGFNKLSYKLNYTTGFDVKTQTLYTFRNGNIEKYKSNQNLTDFISRLKNHLTITHDRLSKLFKNYDHGINSKLTLESLGDGLKNPTVREIYLKIEKSENVQKIPIQQLLKILPEQEILVEQIKRLLKEKTRDEYSSS